MSIDVDHEVDGTNVAVHGRERIARLLDAANRRLNPTDEVVTTLELAVAEDRDYVLLPPCWDNHDRAVLAEVFDHYVNGDDGAGGRAASRLRSYSRERECPHCDGTGVICD